MSAPHLIAELLSVAAADVLSHGTDGTVAGGVSADLGDDSLPDK